jgi:hypothetical protein
MDACRTAKNLYGKSMVVEEYQKVPAAIDAPIGAKQA